jgi:hypothetical protein
MVGDDEVSKYNKKKFPDVIIYARKKEAVKKKRK